MCAEFSANQRTHAPQSVCVALVPPAIASKGRVQVSSGRIEIGAESRPIRKFSAGSDRSLLDATRSRMSGELNLHEALGSGGADRCRSKPGPLPITASRSALVSMRIESAAFKTALSDERSFSLDRGTLPAGTDAMSANDGPTSRGGCVADCRRLQRTRALVDEYRRTGECKRDGSECQLRCTSRGRRYLEFDRCVSFRRISLFCRT